MKKRILIISQYFYPEQFRINDISSELAARGYNVTVITGIPNYPEGKIYKEYGYIKRRREVWRNVEIIRLPLIPRGNSSLFLALNYISFAVSGGIWQLFTRRKADFVFIFEVSPMTQALPGVWFAARRKIPCYLYLQDLWPDNVEIVTGIHSRWIIKPIESMVNYIYRKCTHILVTSNSFAKELIRRGVDKSKISYLPQYAESFYNVTKKNTTEIPDDEAFKIIFTGNIGYAQGLYTLIEVAKLWKKEEQKQICFILVGDGRYKEEMLQEIEKERLNSMFLFLGKKTPEEIPGLLAASDVAFVSFMDNSLFRMTIPAKLQSYMACGIPILAAAEGETAEIIKEAGCGYSSAIGNLDECCNNIKKMSQLTKQQLQQLGEQGRKYSMRFFDKNKLMDEMECLFQTCEDNR